VIKVETRRNGVLTGPVNDWQRLVWRQQVNTVTGGTIDGKIRHADDGSGTNAADVTGATFTQATTATDERVEKLVIPANKLKGFVQYVGTIVTGPAVVGVEMVEHYQRIAERRIREAQGQAVTRGDQGALDFDEEATA
jgi:hypothetical protein